MYPWDQHKEQQFQHIPAEQYMKRNFPFKNQYYYVAYIAIQVYVQF